MSTTGTYLKCSTLRATLPLANCAKLRGAKNGSVCCVCKDWEAITTNPDNLVSSEDLLAAATVLANEPVKSKPPLRFSNPRTNSNMFYSIHSRNE